MALDDHNHSQGLGQNILSSVGYKTLGAPYSRLQVILQNRRYLGDIGLLPQNINTTQVSLGSLASYLYQNEGFLSFFRGHSMSVLKSISSSLLSQFIKPHMNIIFGISSPKGSTTGGGDGHDHRDNKTSNETDSGRDQLRMERTRSVDDPELAHTEVPALLDMITRHQSNMNVNTSINVAPSILIPSKVNNAQTTTIARQEDTSNNNNNKNNNNIRVYNVNRNEKNKNVSFFGKIIKIVKRHIKHEMYPLLSLVILYPFSVFQTYFSLDLKNNINKTTNSIDYAFNQGYYQCYQQLGGTINVLYSGGISAAIGMLIYRQTYFNMHRIVDWLLYKVNGSDNTESHTGNKQEEEESKEEQMLRIFRQTLMGVITTNFAMFVSHPFQMIKYRMILNRHPNSNVKYNGYGDCIAQTVSNQGYGVFFYGASANLLLGVFASVALIVVDVAKTKMDEIEKQRRDNPRNLPQSLRMKIRR